MGKPVSEVSFRKKSDLLEYRIYWYWNRRPERPGYVFKGISCCVQQNHLCFSGICSCEADAVID